mmetsp:Transcript_39381/g.37857  ORF Transcript_39381/g.37857 Transcript_39381/m.37857 type:complete len:91 (-) Transcript_39381:289-561(-)
MLQRHILVAPRVLQRIEAEWHANVVHSPSADHRLFLGVLIEGSLFSSSSFLLLVLNVPIVFGPLSLYRGDGAGSSLEHILIGVVVLEVGP